jgi:GTPase
MSDESFDTLAETIPETYRAGFVAVMGRPNVGKSTLVNALLEQTIAAVSPKPQTTRKRQMGILTLDRGQIIFEDTPGIHHPMHKLGECMNQEAVDALRESDLVLFLVDASHAPTEEDQLLADLLQRQPGGGAQRVFLILNKIDLVETELLDTHQAAFQDLLPTAEVVRISASQNQGLEELISLLLTRLPEHPPFFPPDQLTDLYERDIAADLIRAVSLNLLREEVPYSLAIRIDEYLERADHGAYIAATIFVERESQKGIVIGQGGRCSKKSAHKPAGTLKR